MSNGYRAALVEALGGECARCRTTDGLEIHHKDRDRENNTVDNLELLCNGCHTEEHRGERNDVLPNNYAGRMEPEEIRLKDVNSNGQIYLGREFEDEEVIVAYEIVDE